MKVYDKNDVDVTFSNQFMDLEQLTSFDAIPIPKGATNGEMFMIMYPGGDLHNKETEGDSWELNHRNRVCYEINFRDFWFDEDWWDAPYKKESENR